jgi:succinyl-CoA---D-citramalate CoA-transferase
MLEAGSVTGRAAADGPGPLAGLRVVELGQMLAAPFAGRLLADMGAEVIKVDPPGKPDVSRSWGKGEYRGRALGWPVLGRNKKCITLNLRVERGQELLLGLVAKSDVLLENFRAGTLERWNLGYERLAGVNPGLILARVSGYGQTGRYSDRVGFAAAAEAMGGLRYINGFPDQAPPRLGVSIGDYLAGCFAVQGTLAALHRRATTPEGRGQVVDVSLVESCFALLGDIVPEYDRLGAVREPSGTGLKGIAPSDVYLSRDGKWMVIAANNDNLFRRLCEVMGQPELADDERYVNHRARGQNQDELDATIKEWAAQRDAAEIDETLNTAGVVCSPVYSIEDIFNDGYFWEREMLVKAIDPEFGEYIGPGIVPKFSETPGEVRWSATWEEGSHNVEVYEELLGQSSSDLAALREEGVL